MLTMTLTLTLSLELDVRQGAWIHARLNPHPNRDPNKQVPAPDFYAPTLSKELTVAKLVLPSARRPVETLESDHTCAKAVPTPNAEQSAQASDETVTATAAEAAEDAVSLPVAPIAPLPAVKVAPTPAVKVAPMPLLSASPSLDLLLEADSDDEDEVDEHPAPLMPSTRTSERLASFASAQSISGRVSESVDGEWLFSQVRPADDRSQQLVDPEIPNSPPPP